MPNFINIFTLHSYFLIQIIPSGEDAEVQTASPGLQIIFSFDLNDLKSVQRLQQLFITSPVNCLKIACFIRPTV